MVTNVISSMSVFGVSYISILIELYYWFFILDMTQMQFSFICSSHFTLGLVIRKRKHVSTAKQGVTKAKLERVNRPQKLGNIVVMSWDVLVLLGRKIQPLRKTVPVEEILTINIKPGWKKGTKITFQEKGNEHPNQVPSDLVFIVDEKPHRIFTRDGNDLVVTQKISLVEALTGCTVHVTALDGRNLTIPINVVIYPTYEEVVPREGMPISKDPTKKGNLRIKFDIKFPARLTSSQKAGIKELLGS